MASDNVTPEILAAFDAPGVFSFAELFDAAEAAGAPSSEASDVARAQLRIFCAGTWNDYVSSSLPPLSPAAAAKLRQLTIASMAAKQRILSFSQMRGHLGLDASATHALEDLIVDGIDAGLFKGRIDAGAEIFDVYSTMPRDILPTHAARAGLRDALAQWRAKAQSALESLDEDIARLEREHKAAAAARTHHHDALVQALVESRPSQSEPPAEPVGPRTKRSRP
ncbi:hypothetical protein MCUN1_003582 [Malassezia cuniculi]|uniref:PCI domain-containing protein n=1 Tax=Malassezia cuniculi TaxID=948313 RepID=A0AAF0EX87_9BASI|nr:hypothetical protein MCUN1_003582 [Malassezia cuniculi]